MGMHNAVKRKSAVYDGHRSHPNQVRGSARKKLRKQTKAQERSEEASRLGISVSELMRRKSAEATEAHKARMKKPFNDGTPDRRGYAFVPYYERNYR